MMEYMILLLSATVLVSFLKIAQAIQLNDVDSASNWLALMVISASLGMYCMLTQIKGKDDDNSNE